MLSKRSNVFYLYAIVAFIPAALILYCVLQTGQIPDNDYWNMMQHILTTEGFSHQWAAWIARNNEHLMIIPKLIFAANILLTGGDNTVLGILAWIIALLQVCLLFLLLPEDIRQNPILTAILLLIISVFVFTPRQADLWLMAFGGVGNHLANLFVITAILGLHQFHVTQRGRWLVLSLVSGVLGYLTFSCALAVWPALWAGALLLRLSWRHCLLYLAVGLAVFAIHLSSHTSVPGHPGLETNFWPLYLFTITFIGGLFDGLLNTDMVLAQRLGIMGLISALGLIWLFIVKPEKPTLRTENVGWFMLLIYAAANAVMAGMARFGFGLGTALATRYASFTAYFWMSLGVLALIYCWRTDRLRLSAPLTLLVFALLTWQMYSMSRPILGMQLHREQLKPLAAMTLLTKVNDTGILYQAVSPVTDQFLTLVPVLEKIGHVPFRGTVFRTCPKVGALFNIASVKEIPPQKADGYFDTLTPLNAQAAHVGGWAFTYRGTIDCIALVNQDNIIRGLAVQSFPRPDVRAVTGIRKLSTGWQGYVHLLKEDTILNAYAFSSSYGWYPLKRNSTVGH